MLLVGALLGLAPAASAIPLTGDPSGESVAVFQPLEDPGWPLYSAIRSAGGPFRSPVKVATPPIKSTVVAGNGSGGAIVAWTTTGERIKPTSRVAAAVRAPGKRRFGAPRIVSPESGWATGAAMNGNGDALVLYLTARYPENDLFFSAWRAAGDGTVTPPQVVPTARDDAFEGDAAIALDDRGEATSVAVAESQPADGSDSTYGVVSSTSAQGATWTAPAGISSRLTTEPNPVGIAENGKGAAIAFWAGRRGAEFARREPGQGFTRVATPVRLDPDVFFDADVVGLGLGEDGTGVFAYRSGGKLLASLSEAGSPWSPPRPAIAPRPQVEHPLGYSERP